MVAIYVAEPLAKIFNKSLAVGKYPMLWKMAYVKPVSRARDRHPRWKTTGPLAYYRAYQKYLKKLFLKEFMRLITGTVRRTPVESLRKELGWSSAAVRRRKNRLFLFQKLVYDSAIPEFIKATVPNTRAPVMGRQLRNTRDHIVTRPASRTTAYSHSFIPSTTRIWND